MELDLNVVLILLMFASFIALLLSGYPVAWVLAGVGVAFAALGELLSLAVRYGVATTHRSEFNSAGCGQPLPCCVDEECTLMHRSGGLRPSALLVVYTRPRPLLPRRALIMRCSSCNEENYEGVKLCGQSRAAQGAD